MSGLVERIVNGDKEAEEELVRQYSRGLRFWARTRIQNADDALDITQDVFVVVIAKIRAGEVRKPDSLQSFIYGVAHKVSSSYFTSEVRRKKDAVRDDSVDLVSADLSPFELLERVQVAASVNQMIDQLRMERDRQLLVRYYVDDVDKYTICAELNLTSAQFDRIKHRALDRLTSLVRAKGNMSNDD